MTAILIIDGDGALRRTLRATFNGRGFDVTEAATGTTGVVATADRSPDLVLLELDLPDLEGLEAIRRIRGFSAVPVLVISGRHRPIDKIQALEVGADDYVTKPLDPNEVVARVQAILRRHEPGMSARPARVRFGSLQIDLARRLVTSGGTTVALTKTERRLLELFVTNPGRLLTHEVILREIWGPGHQSHANYLRTYVGQLRKKLGDRASDPRLILTEQGLGYRWIATERR